jgi:hypothetical protein
MQKVCRKGKRKREDMLSAKMRVVYWKQEKICHIQSSKRWLYRVSHNSSAHHQKHPADEYDDGILVHMLRECAVAL